ncbi:hypothetical protein TNCV_4304001 [Trichonephila clavipes]|nr:hypothetical protein TNCV_4304001 [Trichonephila clavipes]
MGVSSRFRLNKITIGIISAVKCYFLLHSPKNWENRMYQLATCDDRRQYICLAQPPYTIITRSVERWQSVLPVVTSSRVFSLTCPLGPELMTTLFQPNPRSEA